MSFVIKEKPTFTWPVKFETPGDGIYQKHSMDVEFKRIGKSRIDEVLNSLKDPDSKVTDMEFVKDVVVGWSGITDQDGNEFPFSDKNLISLCENFPSIPTAIVTTFFEALAGSKRKN